MPDATQHESSLPKVIDWQFDASRLPALHLRPAVAIRKCLPCLEGTFRTFEGGPHRFVDCEPASVCNLTMAQFEEKAPTQAADRVCFTSYFCYQDEWESKAITSTSPRECSRLSECKRDEFALLPESFTR